MTLETILSPTRKADVVARRHVLMYKMRKAGMKYARIAELMNRNHSTVVYGVKRVQELIELKDKLIMELI